MHTVEKKQNTLKFSNYLLRMCVSVCDIHVCVRDPLSVTRVKDIETVSLSSTHWYILKQEEKCESFYRIQQHHLMEVWRNLNQNISLIFKQKCENLSKQMK